MSLTEVSTIASIVSSFAVAASLVYLALQTHQSAKHTKALIWNAIEARGVDLYLGMADENLSRAAIMENGDDATPEAVRQRQCRMMHTAMFLNLWDAIRQAEDGIIDPTPGFRYSHVRLFRSEPAFLRFAKSALPVQQPQNWTPAQQRAFGHIRSAIEEAERPA